MQAGESLEASEGTASPALMGWMARHPLIAYFVMAFAGTWIVFIPVLLSQRGLGVLTLPDAAGIGLFFLATYAGPFAAGLTMTRVTGGKAAVHALWRSIVQWRVRWLWYAVVLLGYPIVFLIGLAVAGVLPAPADLATGVPLLLGVYLPGIVLGLFLPSLGEETGWRGFALPRLQQAYGPLAGSLILGALHGLWHTPAYFVQGMILPGAFDLTAFVANTLAIMAATIVWTWLFNNARGSIFFAILVHATSNANSGLIGKIMEPTGREGSTWFTFALFAVVALAVVILTRGRLSYEANGGSD